MTRGDLLGESDIAAQLRTQQRRAFPPIIPLREKEQACVQDLSRRRRATMNTTSKPASISA